MKFFQKTLILAFDTNSTMSCQNGLFSSFYIIVPNHDGDSLEAIIFAEETIQFHSVYLDRKCANIIRIKSRHPAIFLRLSSKFCEFFPKPKCSKWRSRLVYNCSTHRARLFDPKLITVSYNARGIFESFRTLYEGDGWHWRQRPRQQ